MTGGRGGPHNHNGLARQPDPGLLWHPGGQFVRRACRPQVDQGEHRWVEVAAILSEYLQQYCHPNICNNIATKILTSSSLKECNHCEPGRWWGQKSDGNRRSAEYWVCAHSQGRILFSILILILNPELNPDPGLNPDPEQSLFCRREKRPMRLTGWFLLAMLRYAVSVLWRAFPA